jgi:hypothetical protein
MPLFPYVWQYSNQTIDVLANDVSGLIVNTDKFIPVSNGTSFVDSTLLDDGVSVRAQYLGEPIGMDMHYLTGKYQFGAMATGNSTNVAINDGAGAAYMTTDYGGTVKSIGVDGVNETLTAVGVAATTAGAAAAKFLKIKVDGTDYKIQLLNV